MKRLVVWLVATVIVIGATPSHILAQNQAYGENTHYLDGFLAGHVSTLGVGFVRIDFDWFRIEPSQGNFDFSSQWQAVNNLPPGVQIFATLAYAPAWANNENLIFHYRDFVARAAQEFNGLIWYWGIWNEPNDPAFLWDPYRTIYPALVQHGRDAIKSVNPSMMVLGPDVSSGGVVNGYYAWFMQNYNHLVDIVTVHYYNDGSDETKWVDQFMDNRVYPWRYGKEVWMTETGRNYCHSDGQPAHYQGVLERFEPRRWWWTKIFFYDLYRTDPYCSDAIIGPSGELRTAFFTYRDWIASHP